MRSTNTHRLWIALLLGALVPAADSLGQETHPTQEAEAIARSGGGPAAAVLALSTLLVERLDGNLEATFFELTFPPGGSVPAHRHSGFVLGYVMEGLFELGLDEQPTRTIRAGEVFVEPEGVLHRIGRGGSEGAKVLAIVVAEPGSPTVKAP